MRGGMNDLHLRPRMLQSLVRDRLSDEKRPSPNPNELSAVLSYVKIHGLLSEAHPNPPDAKLADAWSSAVDAWVDRLLSLVSSNMPDKCWAALCLLGVTCEECSSQRFLVSYSLWFQKLLVNIQPPSSTQFVKVASCASLGDLFTRLARFPNLKKDATSLAGKLIQPTLQLLNENGAEALQIMSAKCNSNMSKKFACCLALLPKVRGDEDSWCLMMQKILIALDTLLTDAFRGIEEEGKSSQIIKLLVPPGKNPPPLLGGQSISEESSGQAIKKLHEFIAPRVSALMHCCCLMLTNPYPVQVTVPIRALLHLVWRVLKMDGSLHESLLITSLQQELLCFVLPDLHLDSLELLIAIIKGVRSQLLPHAANVVRQLTDYFRRSSVPSIRIKLYSILQKLLISMGVGMALYLTQEVINNAFADLNDCPAIGLMPSKTDSSKLVNEALVQCSQRKRKHASEPARDLSNGVCLKIDTERGKAPVSVKIAALRALEALLTVGGSLQSECWRSDVDLLLINVATNACDAGWASEGKFGTPTVESTPTRAEFQLASLQALLASLLSPTRVRPPYLSQGLELFRQGMQQSGTKIAAFCAHALLMLEVLIHPRSLPLDDFPGTRSSTFDQGGFGQNVPEASRFYGGKNFDMPPFSKEGGNLGVNDDDLDDNFYASWLTSDDQETPVGAANSELPELGTKDAAPVGNQFPSSADIEMQCADRAEGMTAPNEDPIRVSPGADAVGPAGVSFNEKAVNKMQSREEGFMVSGKTLDLDKGVGGALESVPASDKEKASMWAYGSDTDSLDSLPVINVAEPDSD